MRSRGYEAAMLFGTLPWLYLTLRPGPSGVELVYLVPLTDLWILAQEPAGYFVVQVVGNLLVFAAFGFFAPVRFPALASVPRVLGLAAAGSLAIELTQLLADTGRVFSVDDIWLNALGAALAALASRRSWATPLLSTR